MIKLIPYKVKDFGHKMVLISNNPTVCKKDFIFLHQNYY